MEILAHKVDLATSGLILLADKELALLAVKRTPPGIDCKFYNISECNDEDESEDNTCEDRALQDYAPVKDIPAMKFDNPAAKSNIAARSDTCTQTSLTSQSATTQTAPTTAYSKQPRRSRCNGRASQTDCQNFPSLTCETGIQTLSVPSVSLEDAQALLVSKVAPLKDEISRLRKELVGSAPG